MVTSWDFGTWAMMQFYTIYKKDPVTNARMIALVDSKYKSVKMSDPKSPSKKDPPKKESFSVGDIVSVTIAGVLVGILIAFCFYRVFCSKNKLVRVKFGGGRGVSVNISQTDRSASQVSQDPLRRYETGGRTWIGQVKNADQRIQDQSNFLSIDDASTQENFLNINDSNDGHRLTLTKPKKDNKTMERERVLTEKRPKNVTLN